LSIALLTVPAPKLHLPASVAVVFPIVSPAHSEPFTFFSVHGVAPVR